MLKQMVILTSVFAICMSVNVVAVDQLHTMREKDKTIHVILDELDYYAQDSFADEPVLGATDEATDSAVAADPRVAYLKAFFRHYESDLYEHADVIVAAADTHDIDYRLLPAIAMQESNLCRVIPHNSYNCWGWGIYGDKVTRFSSYPEAIETVSAGLKKYYVDQGLVTPEQIMQKYTPSSNGSWARGVNYFFGKIE